MPSEADFQSYQSPGGLQKGIYGGVTASAAGVVTLPVGLIHAISGTAAITGFTVPYPGFTGFLILIPLAAFTWTTATNIGLAGTAVIGKAIIMVFDGTKWWPSVIA